MQKLEERYVRRREFLANFLKGMLGASTFVIALSIPVEAEQKKEEEEMLSLRWPGSGVRKMRCLRRRWKKRDREQVSNLWRMGKQL